MLRLRVQKLQRLISSYSSRVKQLEADLVMIPEFKEAEFLMRADKNVQAIPLLYRAREITSSVLQHDPLYDFIVAQKIATASRYEARYDDAIAALNVGNNKQIDNFASLQRLQNIAACSLLNGNIEKALDVATKAVDASENHDFGAVELWKIFYPSYGILGLCCSVNGKVDEAEQYLQMSSRWASGNTAAQIISSCNMGAVLWKSRAEHTAQTQQDVLGYWSEALNDFNTSTGEVPPNPLHTLCYAHPSCV